MFVKLFDSKRVILIYPIVYIDFKCLLNGKYQNITLFYPN